MKKVLSILTFIALSAIAWGQDLGIKLEAFKVVPATEAAPESFLAAESAAPGDVIEYRAVYTNNTAGILRNFVPEIPVPAGLSAIEGSDLPKAQSASLDGTAFSPLPLLDATGQPVAFSSLRAFRWNVANLAAGESITLRVRASLAN